MTAKRSRMLAIKWRSEGEEGEVLSIDNKESLGKNLFNFPGPHSFVAGAF